MAIVIGIDVGISTTKIVGINEEGKVISPIRIKATDPVTSLYGAFGKYLYDNNIALTDVEHVMITGVGAAYIETPVCWCSLCGAEVYRSGRTRCDRCRKEKRYERVCVQ